MEDWLRQYRDRHPLAAEWASGSHKVCHAEETQGRVFRMAEQLRPRFQWATVAPLFSILRTLDDVIDMETRPKGRPTPEHAAAAGAVGYKMLFGSLPPMEDGGWPAGFEPVQECEAGLAAIGLQQDGFDPIVIDGIDPAAYLWAFFEMQQRRASCAEVIRLQQHPAHQPRCLAVLPDGMPSVQRAAVPAAATAGQRRGRDAG